MDNLFSLTWQEQAAGSFCVGSIQAVCSLIFHGHVKSWYFFFLFSFHQKVCHSGFLSLSPSTLNNIIWAWWELWGHKMSGRNGYFRADQLPGSVHHIATWMLLLLLRGQYACENEWQGSGKTTVRLMLAHSACGSVLTQGVVSQCSFRWISHSPLADTDH